MNAETFAAYIKSPALLYQLTYEELKTLALQYPFCQNLQLLLLAKSGQDGREYEKNLARAAMYSLDRRLLFAQVLQREAFLDTELSLAEQEEEETLQLRDLSELAEAPEVLAEEPAELSEALLMPIGAGNPPPVWTVEEEEEEAVFEEADWVTEGGAGMEAYGEAGPAQEPLAEEAAEASAPTPVEADLSGGHPMVLDEGTVPAHRAPEQGEREEEASEEGAHAVPQSKTDEADVPHPDRVPPPLPKANFKSWRRRFAAPELPSKPVESSDDDSPEEEAYPKNVREIAESSVADHADITSETLAELLAAQHQYAKAIKMYERLMLKYPEKSTFFAEKIENLKK